MYYNNKKMIHFSLIVWAFKMFIYLISEIDVIKQTKANPSVIIYILSPYISFYYCYYSITRKN